MSEADVRTQIECASMLDGTIDASTAVRRLAARAVEEGLVDVAYATAGSPLGELLIAGTARGVVRIAYLDERGGRDRVLGDLAARLSPRVLEAPARLDDARRQLDDYFEGRRGGFDLAVDLSLVGPFADRVLTRTAAIPSGQVLTYGQVASEIGHARAARAVGNALGSNPIPIVLPCHRVVPSSGGIGGYTGGSHRKEHLLGLERRGAGAL